MARQGNRGVPPVQHNPAGNLTRANAPLQIQKPEGDLNPELNQIRTVETEYGSVGISYKPFATGAGTIAYQPVSIVKNAPAFTIPINQTSNGITISGQSVYQYALQGNQLVPVPQSTTGNVTYGGTVIGTLTPQGLQATGNTVQVPIIANVPAASSNPANTNLGTLTLTPTVLQGGISLT
ncbi:MAG TPA: hypothetical protein VNZ45_02280, partial [Bacteroidia bacterium]|nr:hypothetical protein [Bacteroidia bacterium]